MESLSRAYRLDAPSARFFNAPLLHIARRGERVVARFGRTGFIKATASSSVVCGTWHAGDETGWITLHFDPNFRTFRGTYGVGETGPVLGQCQGTVSS